MNTIHIRTLLVTGVVLCITTPIFVACAAQGNKNSPDRQRDEPAAGTTDNVDWFARTTAGVSIILVLGNFGWDYFKYRWDVAKFNAINKQRDEDKAEQKRIMEEQTQEKVKPTVRRVVGALGDCLVVDVLNERNFSIPIKAVRLEYLCSIGIQVRPEEHLRDGGQGGIKSIEETGGAITLFAISPYGTGMVKEWDLQPRKERRFLLRLNDAASRAKVEYIAGLETSEYRITVHSDTGEIARIDGEKVFPYIRDVSIISHNEPQS
jgi:hypothetical protein